MVDVNDIADFVAARIDEDEANLAQPRIAMREQTEFELRRDWEHKRLTIIRARSDPQDPEWDYQLRVLALIYCDHPDWRPEWEPNPTGPSPTDV